MNQVKICGITEEQEIEWLNEALPDFAGFVVFYPKSKRNLSIERARELKAGLRPEIRSVAVTVSPTAEELAQIEEAGFALVQIHGPLAEGALDAVSMPVLKAFNGKDLAHFGEWESNDKIAGYVFDAQIPGSGKNFEWSVLESIPRTEKLTLLAGGLTPDNVADAMRATGLHGADTSSGVEREDGCGKDKDKIFAFVRAARQEV